MGKSSKAAGAYVGCAVIVEVNSGITHGVRSVVRRCVILGRNGEGFGRSSARARNRDNTMAKGEKAFEAVPGFWNAEVLQNG